MSVERQKVALMRSARAKAESGSYSATGRIKQERNQPKPVTLPGLKFLAGETEPER